MDIYSSGNTSDLALYDKDYSGGNISSIVPTTSKFGNEIAEHIIAITLLLISIYLSTASITYYIRYSIASLRLTDALICLATTMLFLECCWFEVEISITDHSMTFCQAYAVINITISTTMRTIIYTILWLRQRSIYGGPLQHRNGAAGVIGKITLVGILTFGVLQIIPLSLTPQYPVATGGCISGKLPPVLKILVPVIFSLSSTFQFVLLGLTLYPVVKQIREGSIASSKEQLKTIAVRLCICTAICILVDMMFLVVIRLKPDNASISYIPICYAFNTVVNTSTTLCSFANFRQRLWPVRCEESAVETPSENSVSSASRFGANYSCRRYNNKI